MINDHLLRLMEARPVESWAADPKANNAIRALLDTAKVEPDVLRGDRLRILAANIIAIQHKATMARDAAETAAAS